MRRSLILFSILLSVGSIRHNVRMPERRNRMLMMQRRLGNGRGDVGQKVCYVMIASSAELLGCFTDRQPLALKRPPQDPSVIKTQFHLYTREKRKEPDILNYGDKLQSMSQSKFNGTRKLKVIIHGYKGSGNNEGAIAGVQAFLDLEDANVVVVDWAKGAGSTYGLAVSNVELVGRQLGLILLDAVHMGVNPRNIHLVGFSLGAHVAGCASEVLKKNNILLGRITGLDPASPFFRVHLFREKSRKLDASDARLVDVIHTDGSVDFADGFGLLKPIGHIDFFPNGGRQQPGCKDVKNSVVVSHLNEGSLRLTFLTLQLPSLPYNNCYAVKTCAMLHEDSLDIHIACSHVRSWFLFVESLQSHAHNGCKFETWPCKRRFGSYAAGSCFPPEESTAAPELGYAADHGPTGLYYLPTRTEPPYCGYPLRAAVKVAEVEFRPKGVLSLDAIACFSQSALPPLSSLNNRNNPQPTFYDVEAADFGAFHANVTEIELHIKFEATIPENKPPEVVYPEILLINKIVLEDRRGHRWELCNLNLSVGSREESLTLKSQKCS
ncbi:hypothetical protein TSAR_004763 [Trichomalopsis sarcophagae]|uniref:phospholipase A1 n=1 Tax=Trichomalopsis sarcophagae TaxID=543379 RepID=A0A232EM63_9HYME|nr:hypothetical protein TSAR_004763 [Trichomalopsis sarcophagae]